jgi:tetratricopeptide (TPR) repeat protein
MTSRREVFISFASRDEETARHILRAVEARGIVCFFAPRDIPSGANMATEIIAAISGASAILLLLSPESLLSPHVRREVSLAIDERRPILPFAITEIRTILSGEWRYWLSAVQIVDFDNAGSTAEAVSAFLRHHHRHVKRLQGQRAISSPDRSTPISSSATDATQLALVDVAFRRDMPPSTLLRADTGAVPFVGRDEDFARLLSWAERDDGLLVRLLVGPGGSGKTRLARELCLTLRRLGWTAGFILRDSTEFVPTEGTGSHYLLVMDYAETRTAQLRLLLEGISAADSANKIRVLLLARSVGDWWNSLQAGSPALESLLVDAPVMHLAPIADTFDKAKALYTLSYKAFASLLNVTSDDSRQSHMWGRSTSALEIQTSALLDVLEGGQVGRSADDRPVLARLLNHERRYLLEALRAEHLDLDTIDADRVLATAGALGAESESDAVDVLRRTESSADSRTLVRTARLLRRLYPSRDAYFKVQPDLLLEELVSQVTMGSGQPSETADFPELLLNTSTPSQLEHAFTVLGRAASAHEHVRVALRQALDGLPRERTVAAIHAATAVEDSLPIVQALRRAAVTSEISRVEYLLSQLPDETVALADLAADLYERVIQTTSNGSTATDQRSRWRLLHAASNRFSDAGRPDEAVIAGREAVALLRQQVVNQQQYTVDLAAALSSFSNRLWEIGEPAAAIDPALEAVVLVEKCRETDRSARIALVLAAALNNLAFRQIDLGKYTVGAATAHRAAIEFREMLDASRVFAHSGLASSLNNYTCASNALGRFSDAVVTGNECISIRRRQAGDDRDRFLPNLARSLTNIAIAHFGAGNAARAEELAREAVELHIALAVRGSIFAWELAGSGLNLISILRSTRQIKAARDAWQKVTTVHLQNSGPRGPSTTTTKALVALGRHLDISDGEGNRPLCVLSEDTADPTGCYPFALALEYKDL